MPLDPFFAERLRVHRRYLFGKTVEATSRARVTALWNIERAQPAAPAKATAGSPGSRARAKHRRAALAWDRTELETVGTPGPQLRISEHEVPVPGHPPVRVRVYSPAAGGRTGAGVSRLLRRGLPHRRHRLSHDGCRMPASCRGRRHRDGRGRLRPGARAPLSPRRCEQAHAAMEWLFSHAEEVGVDAGRIGVAGTSAGGNIAAALTLMNRDRGRLPLRLQVLEVPVLDLTGRHLELRATRALGIPSLIALRELRSVVRTYLPNRADARSAYASPLLAAVARGPAAGSGVHGRVRPAPRRRSGLRRSPARGRCRRERRAVPGRARTTHRSSPGRCPSPGAGTRMWSPPCAGSTTDPTAPDRPTADCNRTSRLRGIPAVSTSGRSLAVWASGCRHSGG